MDELKHIRGSSLYFNCILNESQWKIVCILPYSEYSWQALLAILRNLSTILIGEIHYIKKLIEWYQLSASEWLYLYCLCDTKNYSEDIQCVQSENDGKSWVWKSNSILKNNVSLPPFPFQNEYSIDSRLHLFTEYGVVSILRYPMCAIPRIQFVALLSFSVVAITVGNLFIYMIVIYPLVMQSASTYPTWFAIG